MFSFLSKLFGNQPAGESIRTLIEQGAVIIDVRTPQEFASGHAKNSLNIPLDQVSQQLKKFQNKSHIILVCKSGARAGQAQSFLERQGITNVTNAGGWQNANFQS